MRPVSLQVLTWGTAAAAVSSAVWLSSTSESVLLGSVGGRASAMSLTLDVDLAPAAAGAGQKSRATSTALPESAALKP